MPREVAAVVIVLFLGITVSGIYWIRANSQQREAMLARDSAELEAELQMRAAENERLSESLRSLRAQVEAQQQNERAEIPVAEDSPEAIESEDAVLFGVEDLREMLLGNDPGIQQLLTPDMIEDFLEEQGRSAALLVAAAHLGGDAELTEAYLREALEMEPNNPMVLQSLIDNAVNGGELTGDTQEWIERLEKADPSNALANYYGAHCKFEAGDVAGGLEEILKANAKTHLNDFSTARTDTSKLFYEEVGCSEGVALSMAAFGTKLGYLATLRSVAAHVTDEAQQLADSGRYEDALRVANNGAEIGNRISSSGRFLINDLVGIACEDRILKEKRRICEALGDTNAIAAIDARLRNNRDRVRRAKTTAGVMEDALQGMTEADILSYMQRLIREGEVSAMLSLPAIQDALGDGGDD